MSSGVRVSAFAKRRKLNDGSTISGNSSPEPTNTVVDRDGKNVESDAAVHFSTGQQPQRIKHAAAQHPDTPTSNHRNTFEPLVAANVVGFSGSREIEKINDTGLKIRLSKGQRCIVQGIAQLWVREGTLFLQGAILSESPKLYTVFGPLEDHFLEITAQSRHAEFQLESIHPHNPGVPSVLNIPGRTSSIYRKTKMSFQVLEVDLTDTQIAPDDSVSKFYEQIQRVPLQLQILPKASDSPSTQIGMTAKTVYPRILVAGKQTTSTSKICTALINRMLTDSSNKHNVKSVGLLDLNHFSPTFACPGTISLCILRAPIFGPSHASPLRPDVNGSNRLVRSYFLGFSEHLALNAYKVSLIAILLASIPHDMPLIVRVGFNFGDVQYQKLLELAALMAFTLCIYAGSSRSSSLYDPIQSIATHQQCDLVQIKLSKPTLSVSSMQAHKLAVQSHFYLYNATNGIPQWLPQIAAMVNAKTIKLSVENNLTFLTIQGGVLRYDDIQEALEGSLVALLAVKLDVERKSSFDQPDFDQDLIPSEDTTSQHSTLKIRMQGFEDVWSPKEFLGMAVVKSVSESLHIITIVTNVDESQLLWPCGFGHKLGIVLEKPVTSGRLTSDLLIA